MEKLWDRINLDGVVERIHVPYLVVHGANDRQIPVQYAHRSYEQAVASPSGSRRSSPSTRVAPSAATSTTDERDARCVSEVPKAGRAASG
ncbi:hypothetical protein ACU610_26385 [Geodermatophilus sp. URMC 61]|uniref:hypothetical protein n=1 Tax=Geodermatophilus sp. URMC 61 TaxID=3423411 RepID=UPI00406BF86E